MYYMSNKELNTAYILHQHSILAYIKNKQMLQYMLNRVFDKLCINQYLSKIQLCSLHIMMQLNKLNKA